MTLRKAANALASLRLTIAVLVVLAGILLAATWLSGYDITVGSLRRDFYGSWWFNALMALLMANLVACTVKRKPWRFWQWGFLVTHMGVFTLMAGAAVSFNWKIYGDMQIQEGTSARTFVEEGEREIVLRAGGAERRYRLDVNPYVPSRPFLRYPVPGASETLAVEAYLPNVSEELVYAAAPGGPFDVIELKLWLGAADQGSFFLRRGESVSNGILGFTFAEGEALYRNLTEEAGPRGTLVLELDGAPAVLDVETSLGKPVRVGDREITIRQSFGSFTLGEDGKPAENAGAPEANPAVLFDLAGPNGPETYYVFALRPEISPLRKGGGMHGGGSAAFAARLRYPARENRVWMFAGPGGLRYAITGSGKPAQGAIAPGEKVRHPGMPIDLSVQLVRRIERAELTVREERPRKGRPALPAVRVRVGDQASWLRLGEVRELPLDGTATVEFAPKVYGDLPFAVELVKFKNPPHEGTNRASKFESVLRIHDSGGVASGVTGVNYPFSYGGWSFYQSAFNDSVRPVISILQVAYDPGKKILYLGCIMTLSGTIFMLFLKPVFVRLVQRAARAPAAAFGGTAALGILALACLGTLVGAGLLLVNPSASGLAVGAFMAGAGVLLMALLTAAAAKAERPAVGLELARAVSAGWCINTAALVLFMILRVT